MAKLIFRIVRALIAIYGLAYIYTAFAKPFYFAKRFSAEKLTWPREHRPTYFYFKAAAALLSIGVLIYFMMFAVTDAIPSGWTNVDEDGEESSFRMGVHWLLTVVATIAAVATVDKVASAEIQKWETQGKAR